MTNDDGSCARAWTDRIAHLPWWACVALALASYLVLHALAARPQAIVTDSSRLASAMRDIVLYGLAHALQFLVPAFCLFGSVLLRLARRLLLAATMPCPVYAMTGYEFERLTSGGLRIPRRARRVPAPAARPVARAS